MYFNSELWVAGAAGVFSHVLIFIHGEWHLQATGLLRLYTILYAVITILEASYHALPWLQAIVASSQLCGAYALCLFASIVVYRTLLHKLHNFPGPVLARVSKLWHVAHCLNSKNHVLMEKLHRQYGDFVRTGMRSRISSGKL